MRGRDCMEAAKALAEDDLMLDRYRSAPAKDVVVERTLTGRPMDRISLATALNLLMADQADSAELRQHFEIALRRSAAITTPLGSYRVASAYVFATWEPPKDQP